MIKLKEIEQLKLENTQLKLAMLDRQREELVREWNSVIEPICKDNNIDVGTCKVDLKQGVIDAGTGE